MKEEAKDKAFEFVPPAKKMVVFLKQHVGESAKAVVKEGEKVSYGQKIGDFASNSQKGATIHSPVNGEVLQITQKVHPQSGKKASAIVLKTLNNDTPRAFEPLDPSNATKEQLLDRVKEAGIVGLGGGGYPTHLKLDVNKPISRLIINAKESDPNTVADYRLMVENAEGTAKGINVMAQILGAEKVIFATRTQEGDEPELDSQMRKAGIEIRRLRPNYSIGAESLLIKELLGKEIPKGHYPPDIGVVVNNVGTALAVYHAVYQGWPLVSRGMTFYSKITGGKNLWVRMGTPISHVLDYVDANPEEFSQIVMGSIFMGTSIPDIDSPTLKATTAITAFTPSEPDPYRKSVPCIRCNYCNVVCPVEIYPQMIMEAVEEEDVSRLKKLHVDVCIDCGLCSYVCPSLIRFTPFLRDGKKLIKQ